MSKLFALFRLHRRLEVYCRRPSRLERRMVLFCAR
jgi:hypothetical protein